MQVIAVALALLSSALAPSRTLGIIQNRIKPITTGFLASVPFR
jgi:hypothetical protein